MRGGWRVAGGGASRVESSRVESSARTIKYVFANLPISIDPHFSTYLLVVLRPVAATGTPDLLTCSGKLLT